MSSNIREFDIGLRLHVERDIPEQVRDFRDAVSLEGLRGLVLLTPVRTGRARGNHQTTVGDPATGFSEDAKDPSGGATIAKGASVIAAATDPYASIWIHNGVPYIGYINDGTPKVTAVHMLERTADRLRRAFNVWRG